MYENEKMLREWTRIVGGGKEKRDPKRGIKEAEWGQSQIKHMKYVVYIKLNTVSVCPYIFKTLKILSNEYLHP